jgi:hypothetical protein
MADTLVSYQAVQTSSLSDTNLAGRVLAHPPGRAAVEQLLQEQKAAVRVLLEDNRHLVAALRDALIDRYELIGREIDDVLQRAEAAAGSTRDAGRAGTPTPAVPAPRVASGQPVTTV